MSLHLAPGDFATVVGSNGAGKSTLFNAICGVFYADEGSILLGGEDVTFKPEYRRSREIGPVGLYGRIGPADRRTVRYETDFEEEVRRCPLPELLAWIAREYPRSKWFREACWRNAADFRQAVCRCRSFEELARMFRCRPEEEPSIRRDLVRFLVVALVVGLAIWLLARYT